VTFHGSFLLSRADCCGGFIPAITAARLYSAAYKALGLKFPRCAVHSALSAVGNGMETLLRKTQDLPGSEAEVKKSALPQEGLAIGSSRTGTNKLNIEYNDTAMRLKVAQAGSSGSAARMAARKYLQRCGRRITGR